MAGIFDTFHFTVKPEYVDAKRVRCAVDGCSNDGKTKNGVTGEITIGRFCEVVTVYVCDSCAAHIRRGEPINKQPRRIVPPTGPGKFTYETKAYGGVNDAD